MDKIIQALKLAKNKKASVCSMDENNNNIIINKKIMLIAKRINLKTYYFASKHSETTTAQFKNSNKACIYFNGGLFLKGLMLEGEMEMLNDINDKKLIWNNKMNKIYKNGGVNDPDFCVLRFIAKYGNLFHAKKTEIIEFKSTTSP